jgi:hypothetical protein
LQLISPAIAAPIVHREGAFFMPIQLMMPTPQAASYYAYYYFFPKKPARCCPS